MVSSIARLVFLVLVFSTSAFIQAANFTNSFDGIVLNHPIDLTWTGDGTVSNTRYETHITEAILRLTDGSACDYQTSSIPSPGVPRG